MYTRLADCGSASVAPAVAAVAPVGDSAVLFMDQLDTTAGTGSLRFRGIDAGGALDTAAPTLIAAPVGTFDLAGAVPGAVIYTVNSGGAGDGVYLRPFGP
jgi:hypothetical protein